MEIQSENEKIKVEIKDSAYDKLNKDSLSKPPSLQDEKAKLKDTIKQIPASSETVKHSKKNKWKPGLLFSGGISGVGNNFLGLVNSPARLFKFFNTGFRPGTRTFPSLQEQNQHLVLWQAYLQKEIFQQRQNLY